MLGGMLGTGRLDDVFPGDGEMARLLRAHDWEASGLGCPDAWPAELRTAARLCVTSRFPIVIWWGEDLRLLYNDAYVPALGERKHPAIGRPGREVWGDIWHIVGPQLQSVVETGIATWSTDVLLPMDRSGYLEETYWTYSYGPILLEGGGVGGVFTPCTETTSQVVSARRLRALHRLGEAVGGRSVEEACALAAEALSQDPADVPFARIYLTDPDDPDCARTAAGTPGVPETVPTSEVDLRRPPWAEVRESRLPALLDLEQPDGRRAAVHPLRSPTGPAPVGYMVAGISPALAFDAGYEAFFALVARQVATLLVSAAAFQDERRRAEALDELDRAKTTFFSNVSHELRTPLTLVLAPMADALMEGRPLEGPPLDMAHRNGLRLLRMVNTLLDFARVEAGRADAAFEPVDLGPLTAELASSFQSVMARGGLELVIEAPAGPRAVHADREMWERIVLNLLSNAFKHTFEGSVAVRVRHRDDHAELVVEDSGVGIDEDALPRVFDRFHRVTSQRARSHEGTGIGLSLVEQLVRLHGGEIDVASTPGEGTAFTVRIPYGTDHLPADHLRSGPAAGPTGAGPVPYVEEAARWLGDTPAAEVPLGEAAAGAGGPRSRILLADDNDDMRGYLCRLLGGRYEVEAVADGEAALAAARRDPPALVISDVMMPRLDGLDLVAALRADERTRMVPVVLLSARSGEDAVVEGLRAGADDYLEKPFSAHELLARVTAHLELGDARRATADRDRLLADASLRLDAALGVEERLAAVVTLLVGGLADMCVVYLRDDDGELVRAAAGHVDPEALEGLLALPGASPWMQRLADSGRSELMTEVTDAHVREMARGETDLRLRRSIAPRSYCGVPVRVRGASVGVIGLGRADGRPPFSEEDVTLIEELGRRIGLAIDNARLYERAQESARVEADRAQALAGLQRLTAALSEALTPTAVADALLSIGLPLIGAAAGGLMILDEDGAHLHQVHLGGYPRRTDRRDRRIPMDSRTPLTDALRNGRIEYADTTEEAVRRWPAMAGFARSHRLDGALAAVPLLSGGRELGALAVRYPRPGPLDEPGRRLLETVGSLAGAALLRASHYLREHSVAETLQRSLLPLRLPDAPGVTIAAGYAAAGEGIEAGGDWYDSIDLGDGRIALMVGDVVGRGPRAASVMGQLRSALRAFASDRRDGPEEVVANLSRFAGRIDGADVATVCYAELDVPARRIRYVCAGHPPPLVVTPGGIASYLEDGRGVPLTVRADPSYSEGVAEIPPGATLVLYTDGLVERRGVHIDRGFAILAEAVARHVRRPPAGMTDAVLGERGGSGDDCALLACRLDAPVTALEIEVPADPRQLRVLRDALRSWLVTLGVGRADADDLVLASGEALANGIEHGRGSDGEGAVRLRAGYDPVAGVLEMVVSDDGAWREPAADTGDRGRGFTIMRALMDRVNVDNGPAGTRVTMSRRLAVGGAGAQEPAPPPAPAAAPDGATLVLEGDIDAAAAAERMAPLTREGSAVRTVNLGGVALLGSAAIQLLFGAARRLRHDGERLTIVAQPGSLSRRLLEITGLDAICDVRDRPG